MTLTLHCPFETPLHPQVELVDQQTLAWGRQFHLLPDAHTSAAVARTKATWLIGWAYPTAPVAALQLIADWNLWLLLWDDLCGGPVFGREPE